MPALTDTTIRHALKRVEISRKQENLADGEGRGTVDHAPVYPREVVRRALELHASAVIMVHNHPTHSFRSRRITLNHIETLEKSCVFGIA